jgi:hypothetical protein
MRTIGVALSAGVFLLEAGWVVFLVWLIRAVNCPWSECAPRDVVYFWLSFEIVLLPLTALAGWFMWRRIAIARTS